MKWPRMPSDPSHRYIPALDGVRAVAILAVMLFHADETRFAAGYFGVDFFFVLSGFLITSRLAAEWCTAGTIGYRRFLLQRLLRLAPPLVAFLLFWSFVFEIAPLADRIAAGLGVANWATALDLVPGMRSRPLMHTWALASEWQFYLLWPWLLIVLLRRSGPGWKAAALLAGAALLASGWRLAVWTATGNLARSLYGLDTRLDGLLIGSALALLLRDKAVEDRLRAGRILQPAACVAFALVAGLLASRISRTAAFGGAEFAFILCAGVLVLGLVLDPPQVLRWLLGNPIAAELGKLSYGLYLWHVPIQQYLMAILGYRPGDLETILTTFGLSLLAALLSYEAFEAPVQMLRRRTPGRAAPTSAAQPT